MIMMYISHVFLVAGGDCVDAGGVDSGKFGRAGGIRG